MFHLALFSAIAVPFVNCHNQSCNTIGRAHVYSGFYLMVDGCHSSITTTDKFKCEKESNNLTEETLPVIDNNGVLYKNVFCARCNNVSIYHYPNINVRCEMNNNTSKNCSFPTFKLPDKTQCTCVLLDDKCKYILDSMTGINYHSALSSTCGFLRKDVDVIRVCQYPTRVFSSQSKLITITSHRPSDGRTNPSSMAPCNSTQIYSIISGKCENILSKWICIRQQKQLYQKKGQAPNKYVCF